jgi:hypothetical protein
MTRFAPRRPSGDTGAFAILYGLLLLSCLGMAAIVVDLGALRQSRRDTRLAADAAAIAGARSLDIVGGSVDPRQACADAWSYLATNLGFTVPVATGCSAFPAAPVLVCPLGPLPPATASVGDYTVKITWPVFDGSTLLTQPNAAPADSTVTSQPVDPAVDGTLPCSRIAVTVDQRQQPAFAGIFGVGTTTTETTSVARSVKTPGKEGQIAALNVLEDSDCDAVKTSGQGSIEVNLVPATPDRPIQPGVIAIESTGRQNGGSCPSSNPFVIDPAKTSSGAFIRADGLVPGDGKGVIAMYALNASPTGNPGQAFDASLVPPGGILLKPKPTVIDEIFGDAPVRDLYNCHSPCTSATRDYLADLVAAYGTATGTPGSYAGSANASAFQTLPGAGAPAFSCTDSPGSKVRVPAGNWFINCATLTVKGVLAFAGGNVVTKGGIDVQGGCLAVNVPVLTAVCPSLGGAPLDLLTPPAQEAILFLRGGDFTKNAQGQVYLGRTFAYMSGGKLDFGGGSGTLYWTNPAPDSTCTGECAKARFGKVALWNESTQDQSLGGQSGLVLRGVIFLPKATFVYTGQTAINQTNAQFWTNKIEVKGQSGLRMAPDPNNSVPRPELGTVLIR